MTTKVLRDNFEIVTAKGVPIRIRDDLLSASRWAKANEQRFPGIAVIRVTITQTEERTQAYRPRPRADDLDVPAMPVRRAS